MKIVFLWGTSSEKTGEGFVSLKHGAGLNKERSNWIFYVWKISFIIIFVWNFTHSDMNARQKTLLRHIHCLNILPRTSKICIHGKLGNHLTIQTENFSLILISPFSFKGSVFRLYTWSTYLECECECCLDSWQWCRGRDYRGKSAGQAILPRYI